MNEASVFSFSRIMCSYIKGCVCQWGQGTQHSQSNIKLTAGAVIYSTDHPADSESGHSIFYLQLVAYINVCFICSSKWPYNFLSLNFKTMTWLMNEIQSLPASHVPGQHFPFRTRQKEQSCWWSSERRDWGERDDVRPLSAGWIMNPDTGWCSSFPVSFPRSERTNISVCVTASEKLLNSFCFLNRRHENRSPLLRWKLSGSQQHCVFFHYMWHKWLIYCQLLV